MTGYAPEELVQNAVVAYGELIYQHDRQMVEETIVRALRERRPFHVTYRIQTRVGEEKWVREQGNIVFPGDEGAEIVVESIVVDVTPRQMEARRQGRERRNRKEQPAAGIAHDFRNIMSIIVLYSELLERQPQHPQRHRYLSTITKQAQHAAQLIGQLLDYSHYFPQSDVLLELNHFLDEMAEVFAEGLPEKIQWQIQSNVSEAIVAADSTRLQQVLLNLVFNARDAMPEGGELVIALSELNLAEEKGWPVAFARRAWSSDLAEERWVQIEVRDQGNGIRADVLPHIFKPFFTTKQKRGGTGLGLVQVDGIVEQLGGTVGVDSREGKGTTFTVYLPLVESAPSMSGQIARHRRARKAEQKILIVEENDLTREALVDGVANLGYQVVAAESGWEALQFIEADVEAIDLLFVSATPTDMSVGELVRYVRRRNADILCLLVNPSGRERQPATEITGEDLFWIQKPFSLQTVARMLRRALDI